MFTRCVLIVATSRKHQHLTTMAVTNQEDNAFTINVQASVCLHNSLLSHINTHRGRKTSATAPLRSNSGPQLPHFTTATGTPYQLKMIMKSPQNKFSHTIRPQQDHGDASVAYIVVILRRARSCMPPMKTGGKGALQPLLQRVYPSK